MAATFQTIPTMDPSESAFVFTMDDNLIKPSNLPTPGTSWMNWELGQKDREIDQEWQNYVFVDTVDAAPGRRAFVFGKLKTGAAADVPFETYYDNEFYRWPKVVKAMYNLIQVQSSIFYGPNVGFFRQFSIKPSAEVESMIKIERFQNAEPWSASKMRHRKPITDDIGNLVRDCLHGNISITSESQFDSYNTKTVNPKTGTNVVMFYPATNFTDWSAFVLKDSQKQVNGMWVREKVTIYPPINESASGKPKFDTGLSNW
jgi:hypothetical protein